VNDLGEFIFKRNITGNTVHPVFAVDKAEDLFSDASSEKPAVATKYLLCALAQHCKDLSDEIIQKIADPTLTTLQLEKAVNDHTHEKGIVEVRAVFVLLIVVVVVYF